MEDLRVNTDIVRQGASVLSSAANNMQQVISRINTLGNQIGGEYQGQLREKVVPILSGAAGGGSPLQNYSLELSAGLFAKAQAIDEVMQSSLNQAVSAFSGNTWFGSTLQGFFCSIGGLGLGIGAFIMSLGLFGKNALPVTTISSTVPDIEQQRTNLGNALVIKYDGKSYADGTYDAHDPYSSHTVDPPVTNSEGDRDSNIYNAVINQFGVETNPRYEARNNNTYCNIFAWDVSSAMGAAIPHWVDPKTGVPTNVGVGIELNANGVVDWLRNYGSSYGWHVETAAEAQADANKGFPVVAGWSNTGGIGHVAMVRPGKYSASTGPIIAQAGGQNLNVTTVASQFADGWTNDQIVYYVHD